MDEVDQKRVDKVSGGLYLIMRGASYKEGETPLTPDELSAGDMKAIRDIAGGLIRAWDGLNGR